jgi:hypothetical protein
MSHLYKHNKNIAEFTKMHNIKKLKKLSYIIYDQLG